MFRIDQTTGAIYTIVKLDREMHSRYELCIKASNDPDLNITFTDSAADGAGSVSRKRRDVTYVDENDDSVLKVIVDVEDVDDHGPDFDGSGTGSRVVTGAAWWWWVAARGVRG